MSLHRTDTLTPLQSLRLRLDTARQQINRLEQEARHLLYSAGDQEGYTACLRQRAIHLSCLVDELDDLDHVPPGVQSLVRERLGGFAHEAERALRVDSIFYMSVLLLPEGHRDGMPNEMDELVAQLGDVPDPDAA